MILESGIIAEKFMIVAILITNDALMTGDAMTGILDDMGQESGCTPGSMVLMSRLAKQFYRRSDEQLLGMHLRHLVALAYVWRKRAIGWD